MRILIVDDGNQRGALAAVRALGSSGAWVAVAAPHKGLAATSRWCRRYHAAPSPSTDSEGFLSGVRAAIEESRPDLLFPVGDAELFTLSAARDELDTHLPYADHEVVLSAFDKVELSERARRVGLKAPATATTTHELRHLRFPVVVKERLHGAGASDFSGDPHPVTVADNLDAAAASMEEIARSGGQALAQEFVRGDLVALICLLDGTGEPLAVVQQRALRTFPPGAGVSTRACTEEVDPRIAERSVALLRELGWVGLVEMQFLAADDGEAYLIDLNGRFYGSLALAVSAGADVATAWSAAALGGARTEVKVRPGHRYQWLEGDLRRATAERKGGLVRDVMGCLSFAPTACHSIWSLRDPVPAITLAFRLATRAPGKVTSLWR